MRKSVHGPIFETLNLFHGKVHPANFITLDKRWIHELEHNSMDTLPGPATLSMFTIVNNKQVSMDQHYFYLPPTTIEKIIQFSHAALGY